MDKGSSLRKKILGSRILSLNNEKSNIAKNWGFIFDQDKNQLAQDTVEARKTYTNKDSGSSFVAPAHDRFTRLKDKYGSEINKIVDKLIGNSNIIKQQDKSSAEIFFFSISLLETQLYEPVYVDSFKKEGSTVEDNHSKIFQILDDPQISNYPCIFLFLVKEKIDGIETERVFGAFASQPWCQKKMRYGDDKSFIMMISSAQNDPIMFNYVSRGNSRAAPQWRAQDSLSFGDHDLVFRENVN